MRFDPNKTYPYPVLRPGSSDYPHAEFEVELEEPERVRGTTALRIEAEFQLSDQALRNLVARGAAKYVLLVRSPATHHRSVHCSFNWGLYIWVESRRIVPYAFLIGWEIQDDSKGPR